MNTVFITGTNRGLGLEFVRQYRAAGWNVIATVRKPEEAGQVRELGAEVLTLDLQDENAIRELPRKLQGRRIDLLINNAGYHPKTYGRLGQFDASNWQTTFHVNVIAPVQIVEALSPLMPDGAKIVNLGSRQGSNATNLGGSSYVYRASKAAAHSVSRSMAADLAPRNILVVTMHPGWVKTDQGGKGAEIEPEVSIAGIRRVVENLTLEQTGHLINYDGTVIPW